jgi:hypothetical protein
MITCGVAAEGVECVVCVEVLYFVSHTRIQTEVGDVGLCEALYTDRHVFLTCRKTRRERCKLTP